MNSNSPHNATSLKPMILYCTVALLIVNSMSLDLCPSQFRWDITRKKCVLKCSLIPHSTGVLVNNTVDVCQC